MPEILLLYWSNCRPVSGRGSAGMNSAVAPEKPATETEKDQPFVPELKEFKLDWKSGSGRRYQGTFRVRIASVRDHMVIGGHAATFRGGMPVTALDQSTIDLSEMVGTIQTVIEAVGYPPDWFKNIPEIHDITVIEMLYAEVSSHWASFRSRGRSQGESEV